MTINTLRVATLSKSIKRMHELFEDQGHGDCFLLYPGCCDGTVGTQWPDCQSALLYWNLN